MHLGDLIKPELIYPDLKGSDRPTVLRAMADKLAAAEQVEDADELYRRLWEREELGTTATGAGVAIPHCKMAEIEKVILAIGLSTKGVDFQSEDGEPVRLLFLVVSPENAPAEHLRSLAAISKWVKQESRVERLLELEEPEAIFEALKQEEV